MTQHPHDGKKYEIRVPVLLFCSHINTLMLESEIFIPIVGTVIQCNVCHQEKEIERVGRPYRSKKAIR